MPMWLFVRRFIQAYAIITIRNKQCNHVMRYIIDQIFHSQFDNLIVNLPHVDVMRAIYVTVCLFFD